MFDSVVSGGTVILPTGPEPADIGVNGEHIAAIGAPGSLAAIPGSSPGTSATVIKGGGVPVIAEADRGSGMTRRTPSFVRAPLGRWRITEMDERDGLTDPQPRISREDSASRRFRDRSRP